MKKILLFALILLSIEAYAQSYFVLDNGVTLSVDTKGYVFDLSHYTPINRVTVKGGQYMIEDSNVIVTVDEQGSLFRKYEVLPAQVKGKGMNYLIGENGSIITVDNMGYTHLVEDDTRMLNATKFGGTFFIVNEELFTVTTSGSYGPAQVEGLKTSDIISLGGNYFMTNRGVLYTISFDGKVSAKTQDRVGIIVKKGGNYFVDTMGILYTIAQDGSLKLPALPISLRIQAMSKLGANYFMDGAGKLFTVDKDGNIFERWTDYDLKTAKMLSL